MIKVDKGAVLSPQRHTVIDGGVVFCIFDVLTDNKVNTFAGTKHHGDVLYDLEVFTHFFWLRAPSISELKLAGKSTSLDEIGGIRFEVKDSADDVVEQHAAGRRGVFVGDADVLGKLNR